MTEDTISRRAWLASVPRGLGLAAAAGVVLRGQEYRISGADLKLGIASYSFRKFSRAQAIEMTKQLGTPYLNIKDVHLPLSSTPEEIDAAKKEFDGAGIVLVGCGNVDFRTDDEADMRHKFDYAKRAGFPLIVCAPTAVTLPKLEKFVREYDIKIAVHNHGPEDKNFPTPQSVLKIVKDMDPRCGCCIDVGHTSRTGVDVVQAIAEAGTRLLDMHIKDLANPMGKESQVAVGEGKLPIRQIFAQLIKMKYAGCVNLEYEIHAEDPLPGMQKSFAYMRQTLSEMKA
ncbi:MAG: sugar phosphate isomerase/epimerase [Acidobacteriaceae bacterium]|nr:sugar phosphate isomerase/epimerase [Acidobacteriaceae bacterium]